MKKINLRALEPDDIDVLYEVENDSEVWAEGVTTVPYSKDVLRNYVLNTHSDIYADREVRLVAENAEGETVGIVDLTNFDPKNNRAEVGIVVRKKWRQQGFGTVMLQQLIDYATSVLHLHQLYAFVSKENVVSVRLFEERGFTVSGTLHDWINNGTTYKDCAIMQLFL